MTTTITAKSGGRGTDLWMCEPGRIIGMATQRPDDLNYGEVVRSYCLVTDREHFTIEVELTKPYVVLPRGAA